MSIHFEFLKTEWPELHQAATKAESFAYSDPRTACFHTRRALEIAVKWLYKFDNSLARPYRTDLSAHLSNPSFKSLVGNTLHIKLELIRRLGNQAVHSKRLILHEDSVAALRELFDFCCWIGRSYSTKSNYKPDPSATFQPDRLPKSSIIPQNLPRSGVVEFVGRDQTLKDLHDLLQKKGRNAIAVIAGMGGIGKTELALQYAISQLKQGKYPAGVCWLKAKDQEMATQIVTFAKANLGLSLPEQLEIKALVSFCWQHWSEGEALIILDDVTDYEAISPYLPPSNSRFKLLITTRLDLGKTFRKVAIEELDQESAIALLESLTGKESIQSQREESKVLCKWAGYLPLALELLGRFLARKPDWTINRLQKRLHDQSLAAKLLTVPESGMTAQFGLTATLDLSWKELSDAEQKLACVFGMFAVAPISWTLIEQCLTVIDSDDLEEIRDEGLIARSLLKRVGKNTYQVHQILQEYFRIKLHSLSDGGQKIKGNFCHVMVEVAKTIEDAPTLDEIVHFSRAVVHIEEVTSQWIDCLAKEDLMWPFLGIARFYQGQGLYSLAEPWRKKCLEVTQKQFGQEHPFVAASLNNLAALYSSQGRYKEAESLYLQALELMKVLGNENPSVATSLNNLAGLYESQGRFEEAEPLYLQVLELRQKVLSNEHPDIAETLNDLAVFYSNQGRFEDAESHYLQALNLRQKGLSNEHPDIAETLNNLAGLYDIQGRYEEAESLYLQALELFRNVLGNDHPSVATSLNNLALLRFNQGRYEEVEPLLLQALKLREDALGDHHPDFAISLNSLAFLYSSQGRFEEAESLYLQALKLRRKVLGNQHPDVAQTLNNLAELYSSQRRYKEAEPLYLQALELRRKTLGNQHPDFAISLNNLAVFYNTQRLYKKAEPLYLQALELRLKIFGDQHSDIAISKWNLGVLYQNQKRYSEAKHIYQEALAIAEKVLGYTHDYTIGIWRSLNSLPK